MACIISIANPKSMPACTFARRKLATKTAACTRPGKKTSTNSRSKSVVTSKATKKSHNSKTASAPAGSRTRSKEDAAVGGKKKLRGNATPDEDDGNKENIRPWVSLSIILPATLI